MHQGVVRVFTAGATALQVVAPSKDRISISFNSDGTCFLKPGTVDVTVTTGIPVTSGNCYAVHGKLAQKRWTVVSAATPILGVTEYFEGPEDPMEETTPAVPTGSY